MVLFLSFLRVRRSRLAGRFRLATFFAARSRISPRVFRFSILDVRRTLCKSRQIARAAGARMRVLEIGMSGGINESARMLSGRMWLCGSYARARGARSGDFGDVISPPERLRGARCNRNYANTMQILARRDANPRHNIGGNWPTVRSPAHRLSFRRGCKTPDERNGTSSGNSLSLARRRARNGITTCVLSRHE